MGDIRGLLESSSPPYRSGIQSLTKGIPLLPRIDLAAEWFPTHITLATNRALFPQLCEARA
jgi:hypothetical protein